MFHIRALQSWLAAFSLTVTPVAFGAIPIETTEPVAEVYTVFVKAAIPSAKQAVERLIF